MKTTSTIVIGNRELVLDALRALYSRKLKPNQRLSGSVLARAVYLRYFKGLRLAEIAQEFDVSVACSRVYVEKGLSFIRKYLVHKYGSHALDAYEVFDF